MTVDEIFNAVWVNENLLTAGQPTEDQIKAAAADGFTRVINLATFDSGRSLPDEAGLVQSLNMTYINIPVIWQDPKLSDFEAFEQLMNQPSDDKTLIHCQANFRVTAFYSLYAQKHLGWSAEQGEAFRAQIWQGSNYPVWMDFIDEIKATLA